MYYLEERLVFGDQDVATLFLIMGLLGILVQGFLLKLFNDCLGERRVVVLSFGLGMVTNLLYGIGRTKSAIFVAVAIGAFSGMAFPSISAIKSNNVVRFFCFHEQTSSATVQLAIQAPSEQGRIQGALSALQSLASGIGPVGMRFVYQFSKDGSTRLWGPGTMFVAAASLYLIAVCFACALPVREPLTVELVYVLSQI